MLALTITACGVALVGAGCCGSTRGSTITTRSTIDKVQDVDAGGDLRVTLATVVLTALLTLASRPVA